MNKDWQNIDRRLHGAVTASTFAVLFIGDQIYNHIEGLKESLKNSSLNRHFTKYKMKQMEKESKRYNFNVFSEAKCDQESYAEITMLMEDHLLRHIEVYGYSVSSYLLKNGISGEVNHLITSGLVINMLAQTANVAIKELEERLRSINISTNPLSYLMQLRMDSLSMSFACSLTEKDLNLSENKTIADSFAAFANGLFSKPLIEKLLEI